MASDSSGLFVVLGIFVLFAGIIIYSLINRRMTADKRKHLIRAFKASPVVARDRPILVEGNAAAPDTILPTTGEHVAFYGMFVLSRESAISATRTGPGIRINGIPLGTLAGRIDAVEGFLFFETSGDFTVASAGTDRVVRVTGLFEYFRKGADMVGGFVLGRFKEAGLPENFFHDVMNFKVAQQVLNVLCGFDAPLVTERSNRISGSWNRTTTTQRTTYSVVAATSRIDTRVHHFLSGFNLPQGVMDLIVKRGIELPEKEEVIVIETYIPLNRKVYAFGTFDGDRSITYSDGTAALSVSYTDPEGE